MWHVRAQATSKRTCAEVCTVPSLHPGKQPSRPHNLRGVIASCRDVTQAASSLRNCRRAVRPGGSSALGSAECAGATPKALRLARHEVLMFRTFVGPGSFIDRCRLVRDGRVQTRRLSVSGNVRTCIIVISGVSRKYGDMRRWGVATPHAEPSSPDQPKGRWTDLWNPVAGPVQTSSRGAVLAPIHPFKSFLARGGDAALRGG